MTLKELQEVEEKGKQVLKVLDALTHEFEQQSSLTVDIQKDLNLFASGKPCFTIKKKGLFGKKLFYFRNAITNPRQPSPIFVRIYEKQYEKQLLDLLHTYQPQVEEALRVRVVLHQEEKV